MKTACSCLFVCAFCASALAAPADRLPTNSAPPFEGRIRAAVTRAGQTAESLYTAGPDQLRVERTDTNRPHARNILDRRTGDLILLFPHNRSFVRLKASGASAASPVPVDASSGAIAPAPGAPPVPPAMSTAIGPANLPGVPAPPTLPAMPPPPAGLPPGIGPQAGAAAGWGALPMMPMEMVEKPELKATGQKTNLLGYACEKFELQQRGEVMEIWATDKLLPFQVWLPNQPHRFGPRMLEEQ